MSDNEPQEPALYERTACKPRTSKQAAAPRQADHGAGTPPSASVAVRPAIEYPAHREPSSRSTTTSRDRLVFLRLRRARGQRHAPEAPCLYVAALSRGASRSASRKRDVMALSVQTAEQCTSVFPIATRRSSMSPGADSVRGPKNGGWADPHASLLSTNRTRSRRPANQRQTSRPGRAITSPTTRVERPQSRRTQRKTRFRRRGGARPVSVASSVTRYDRPTPKRATWRRSGTEFKGPTSQIDWPNVPSAVD